MMNNEALTPKSVASLSIGDLADKLIEIKRERKELKSQDDRCKDDFKVAASRLKEVMLEEEMEKLEQGGGVIRLTSEVRGRVIHHPEFFLWLKEHGEEALGKLALGPELVTDEIIESLKTAGPDDIKVVVNWSRLSAFTKEMCDPFDRETWPDGVEVDAYQDIKVRLK